VSGIIGGVLIATHDAVESSDEEPPPAADPCQEAALIADRQAREANAACYAEPDVTGSYLDNPYHAARRRIAVRLLARALDAPTTPAGPLLEIGTGARPMLDDLLTGSPSPTTFPRPCSITRPRVHVSGSTPRGRSRCSPAQLRRSFSAS
jgi:hypothetical protein